MANQLRPQHPLLMKSVERRNRVSQHVRQLTEDDMRNLGNWHDVDALGRPAELESIDLDDEEIFEPKKGEFECLATLYVTLHWPEDTDFSETFVATIRGAINAAVRIDNIQIDTSSFTGEPDGDQH